MMTDSQPYQNGGDNLPTFIRRNNLYLSNKNTLLISGHNGTTTNPVIKEDIGSGVDVMENVATEKSIMKKAEKRFRILPPLLSSLNRNGRPRFSLESVREDGRLQILLVPNQFSEVVRTCQEGDRVSMELLETGAP